VRWRESWATAGWRYYGGEKGGRVASDGAAAEGSERQSGRAGADWRGKRATERLPGAGWRGKRLTERPRD
jgi:hypothetical protein